MKRALVILAEGAEEMEVTISVDVLRRGGVEVVLAGLDGPGPVRCSRGVTLVPDRALADLEGPWDVILLPGGAGGAERLAASAEVGRRLREHPGLVAAICAAPTALAAHGLFAGARMTCHPSVRDRVAAHARHEHATVVEDGRLVTAPGPGATFAFALAVLGRLTDRATVERVREPLQLPA